MHSNFLLGRLCISEAVQMKLKRMPFDLVARHAINEYGHVSPTERRANTHSMKYVGQILSRYPIDPTNLGEGYVLVITDEDWETTTVKIEGEK